MHSKQYSFETSLGYLTGSLSRLILARNVESFASSELGISSEQWIVLIHIWNQEGIRQQTIADHMKIDKTSFTRLITKLEKADLLIRRLNPDDAREKFLYLTEKGRSVMDQATLLVQEILDKSCAGIDPDHLEICRAVLRKAHSNLM